MEIKKRRIVLIINEYKHNLLKNIEGLRLCDYKGVHYYCVDEGTYSSSSHQYSTGAYSQDKYEIVSFEDLIKNSVKSDYLIFN